MNKVFARAIAFAACAGAAHAQILPSLVPPVVPVPISNWTMQVLGDSRANNCSIYAPTVSASGGVKSLCLPATWVEAAVRGVRFDMTIAPSGSYGYVVGLKQIRGYAGTGCSAATATVTGATGFTATAKITKGSITGWTVATPQTAGTAGGTYSSVSITSDCSGTVYATPVLGGYGTFGVAGQNLLEIRERAADLCAGTYGPVPSVVQVWGAENDLAIGGGLNGWSGNTLSITGAVLARRMMDVVSDLRACGIFVQVLAAPPRSISALTTAGMNTTQAQIDRKTLAEFNYAMRLAANKDKTFNPSGLFFLFCDQYIPYYIDNSNSNGDPIVYMTYDGTHPTQWGGAVIGYWAAKQLLPYIQMAGFSSAIPALDAYDSAYNTSGNISNTYWNGATSTATGLITGTTPSATFNTNTGGTAPSAGCITAAATVPTGSVRDAEGLVTPSLTLTYACGAVVGSGSANLVQSQIRWGTTFPAGIATGDYLETACDVEYANLANIVSVSVGVQDPQNVTYYIMGGASNGYMPRASDPLVGSAGEFGWFGWPLRFHSAPMLVQANTTSYSVFLTTYMDVSETPGSVTLGGWTAGAGGTVKFRNCTLQEYRAGTSPVLQ